MHLLFFWIHEYGLPASDARNKECGLLLAYEKLDMT